MFVNIEPEPDTYWTYIRIDMDKVDSIAIELYLDFLNDGIEQYYQNKEPPETEPPTPK